MSSYRLLRSNKESGPYSLNDLVTLGLKPYDLVWVDGRSAAWRYPSEISELKDYAPVVEEQPFDRFFKKPSGTEEPIKEITSPAKEKIIPVQKTINESLAKEEPVKKIITEAKTSSLQPQPKKQVFVSMPETNGFSPYQNPYQDEKYEQYLPKPKPAPQNSLQAEEKTHSPINIRESDGTKPETKYTQSLDDIKEMYINTLVQRKTRNRRKEVFRKYVKPAIVPVALLVAGVVIGYVITGRKNSQQASEAVTTVIPSAPQTVPEQKKEEETPADNNGLQPDEQQNSISSTDNKKENIVNPQENKLTQPQKEKQPPIEQKQNKNTASLSRSVNPVVKQQETFTPSDESSFVQKKDVEVDPVTGERKSVVRNNNDVAAVENNVKNNPVRSVKKNNSEPVFLENNSKDIRNLVSVKSNDYIRGAFGGIRGLELTVYNNSNFLVDEVSVELQIMKPSEQPLRTDIITFKNIAANGAVTVKVPDSQRGIRVDYRITNIESRQWQKSTAGL